VPCQRLRARGSDEAIATGPSSPSYPTSHELQRLNQSRESLKQDFIIDLIAQVTDEDMEVIFEVSSLLLLLD